MTLKRTGEKDVEDSEVSERVILEIMLNCGRVI